MKILTKEEEAEHYNATLKGGALGTLGGLGLGTLGVLAGARRFQFFRQLTLPFKAFLVTSGATFAGVIAADHASHAYERSRNVKDVQYHEREQRRAEAERAGKSFTERAMDFGRKERYKIVGASWIASMFAAFALVSRNKFLTGQQKLVQARVYAQFLTVGVLVATAAFEISDSKNETGRYETVTVLDPSDPTHKRYIEKQKAIGQSDGDDLWKEMVAAEEERLKEEKDEENKIRKEHPEKHHKKHKNGNGKEKSKNDDKGDDGKDDKDDDKKDDDKKDDDKKKSGSDEKKRDSEKEKKQDSEKEKKQDSEKEKKQDGDKEKSSKKEKSDDAKGK